MIGNENGSRNDVIIQWISREYLIKNKKEMKDIPVGPDEYFILIKEGKVAECTTESQVDAVPGLLRRFADYLGAKKDVQLVLVDARKHPLSIPFEAYTRDRALIRGKADLFACISKENPQVALRLLKESAVHASDIDGFREFTLQDLSDLLSKNTEYIIDTESISLYDAKEIAEKRKAICTDMVSALNSKTPYWINYGLEVNYSTVTIDENEYERLERVACENKLKARQRELEYMDASGDSEHAIRMDDLRNRQEAAVKLNKCLSEINAEASKRAHESAIEHKERMSAISDKGAEAEAALEFNNRLEVMKKYHEQEIRRIESDGLIDEGEKQIKMADIQLRIKDINLQMERNEGIVKHELERLSYELDRDRANDDLDRELQKLKCQAELMRLMTEPEDKRKDRALDIEEKKIDADVEKTKIQTNADVEKTRIENSADVVASRKEAESANRALDTYKEATKEGHEKAMQFVEVVKDTAGAVSGAGSSSKLTAICPSCNKPVYPPFKFCGNCGITLSRDE